MNFSRKFRLMWIDAMLSVKGGLNRRDVCQAFDLSVTQASRDINLYIQKWPHLISYDPGAKIYLRVGLDRVFGSIVQRMILAAHEEVVIQDQRVFEEQD